MTLVVGVFVEEFDEDVDVEDEVVEVGELEDRCGGVLEFSKVRVCVV